MDTQVSTPIKIFAALGLLLALGFGAMTMMKGGSSASSESVPTPAVTHPVATPAATTPAAQHAHAASVKPHAAKPATHAAKPAAHPVKPAVKAPAHAKARHHAKPHQPVPAVAANGLPGQLDLLLHIHRVVVVAVYDPEIQTDRMFVGEAQAGARDAHAGFLAVSVLDEHVAAPLTAAAGQGSLLPSPGLLVYKQPAVLMNIITGFVDRAAVAEAVANALLADAPPQSTTTGAATTPAATPPVAATPTTASP